MDLDTAVVGSCDHWLQRIAGEEFVILRDFYRGARNPRAMGSGLMYWAGDMGYVWRAAQRGRPMREAACDQTWLERTVERAAFFQDFTDDVLSFKADVRAGRDWRAASIICFHGRPRPWEQQEVPGWQ